MFANRTHQLKMSSEASLFEYDLDYREFLPGRRLPTKKSPTTHVSYAPELVHRAEFDDSDILMATYPKTGWACIMR